MADNSLLPSTGHAGLPVKTTPTGSDSLYIVDAADTSQSAAGTSKSLTIGNLATFLASQTQTYTNKTINGNNNTLTVLGSQVSGNISGNAGGVTGETFPVGTIVGTTDIQTLTNKTLTSPVINVTSDAQGDVYYRNGSGNFARLAPGTNGQFLQTQGAAANPQWANAVNFATTGQQADFTTSSGSFVDVTGVTITINPTRTVTVYAMVSGNFFVTTAQVNCEIKLLIDGVSVHDVVLYPSTLNQRIPFSLNGQASVSLGARVIKLQLLTSNVSDAATVGAANLSLIWG